MAFYPDEIYRQIEEEKQRLKMREMQNAYNQMNSLALQNMGLGQLNYWRDPDTIAIPKAEKVSIAPAKEEPRQEAGGNKLLLLCKRK